MEVAGNDLQTLTMDHHGLVAAACKDLGISAKIDQRIGSKDERRVVSAGQAVIAMILNGLGFTNRRLYLTHQFFETKPVARLLDAPIQAKDLTDYTLGHALDEIANYGSSKLFGEVAFEIALEHDLLSCKNHLDTTSLSVHGEYGETKNAEPTVIEITHGYSKDHRHDLKQVVLSLVVNGPSSIPIWMEPLSGNSSDKSSFHETIKKVEEFKEQISLKKNFKWVADSALYTTDKLLKENKYLWLSRVPESIGDAKALVEMPDNEISWTAQEKGYKTASISSNYGGQNQRWLLIYSEQAYQREKKTFEKKLEKQSEALKRDLWHLGNEIFSCNKDGLSSFKKIEKKYAYYKIEGEVVPILKYPRKGKPKAGDEKIIAGYQIRTRFERDDIEIEKMLCRKGRFILATNDLNDVDYTDQDMLNEYKAQQNVEGGFRFLKDPWFMVDSIFLKTPRRIEALMMVMTLCLMVYNVSQYKLRRTLVEKQETLPNQLKKQVQNPTLKWVFQIMEGVAIVQFYQDKISQPIKEAITNINELRKKIIMLFGDSACRMYGLIVKNQQEILGM